MSKSRTTPDPKRLPWSHRRAAVLLLPFLLATAPAAAELNHWSGHGPNGGDVFALAVDPLNPQTLYAGTAGTVNLLDGSCQGAFRSTDGGDTWAPINRGLPDAARCVAALLIDPESPHHLFAGTSRGIYRSADGGDTWNPTGEDRCQVRSLAVDPQSSANLYAGTACGVLRSTDGGDTWTGINDGFPDSGPVFTALAVDPEDGDRLYAATAEDGVFRSVDDGGHWTALAGAPRFVSALVIDPASPDTLWANDYRSTDGGETWEDVFQGLDARVDALALDPDSGTLYAASNRGVFRSVDGGTTWSEGAEGLYTETVTLAVVPGTSNLFAGTLDTGVFRSADGGDSWAPSSHGPVTRRVIALAVDPSPPVANTVGGGVPPSPVFAATDRGMYLSTDGGRSWMPRNRGLGGRFRILGRRALESITDLAVDPQDPAALYISTKGENGVYRSTDGGQSWERAGLRATSVFELAIDPDTPQNLLAAEWSSVYRSTDRGESWDRVLQGSSDDITALEFAPSAPSRVYAIAADLLLSDDGGMSWAEIAGPVAGTEALVVDPEDPFSLWAATEEGVLRSQDGGMTWTAGLLGLPEIPVLSLAIDPGSVLYAGTSRASGFNSGVGVYRSIDGGTSWWPVARGLPQASYRALAVDPRISALYAGASDGGEFRHEDGVFQIDQIPSLELHGGRFRVEVAWREFRDLQGRGHVVSVMPGAPGTPVPLRSQDSAILEFFGPDNWELVIKVLDGRALNDHFWVFFAAATNVGYTLTVTDTACGQQQSYLNILGRPAPAVTDVEAFAGCPSPQPPSCEADAGDLCLGEDGRFQVDLAWHDFVGNTGVGRQVTIPEGGLARSDDSGLFYFFGNDNWEVLIKVLDGCRFNDHFWVFSAATTDVEYQLTVTDTVSGEVRTYLNPLSRDAEAVTDVEAFGCDAGP